MGPKSSLVSDEREEESSGDKEAIYGRRRRCGFGGCERKKERKKRKSQMKTSVCTQTH